MKTHDGDFIRRVDKIRASTEVLYMMVLFYLRSTASAFHTLSSIMPTAAALASKKRALRKSISSIIRALSNDDVRSQCDYQAISYPTNIHSSCP